MPPAFVTTFCTLRISSRSSNFLSAEPTFFSTTKRHRCAIPIISTGTKAQLEPLVLSEENVNVALEEVKETLGSMFGNSAENRDVGITGDVELASLDGPIVVLRLKGRFWHKRSDVLARVSAYITERIPEVCDTEVEDVRQLEDSEEESDRLVS